MDFIYQITVKTKNGSSEVQEKFTDPDSVKAYFSELGQTSVRRMENYILRKENGLEPF